ncbi:ROK family protein [Kineococcus gynurae]|uniref:ROK family protein n=1 Tax=Kineococcus gynurae TaxID=452979 RepID=A0ABV5LX17_9ACTN
MSTPRSEEVTGTGRDVAVELLRHGPLSRTHLARRLGLSAGSLTRLSKPLVGAGVVVEGRTVTDPGTRRPMRPLDLATDRHHFLGVNIAAESVTAVVTDLRTTVGGRLQVATEDPSPEWIVATVAELVEQLSAGTTAQGLGVSIGGYMDPGGVVRFARFLGWERPLPLGPRLSAATGLPVVLSNDLAALTRAEHWFGAGRGQGDFAVITIGAGVGYGLVLHDQLVENSDTAHQLLGHHRLAFGGPRCVEGHQGCATALLTQHAMAAAATVGLGRTVEWEELLQLARADDPVAGRVVEEAAAHLGHLAADVANFTGVRRILLTGESIEVANLGRDALFAALREHRDPNSKLPEVVVQPHDRAIWARGAAGVAVQQWVEGSAWLGAPA